LSKEHFRIEIISFNQKMLPKFVKCNGSNGLKEIAPAGMQLVLGIAVQSSRTFGDKPTRRADADR
jgi:hypothetical protein